MVYYRLTPLDTALFRDARPFSADDANGARLGTFLPPQLGVLGALRHLLIEQAGITYQDFQAGHGTAVLGTKPDCPGSLALGPVLWGEQESTQARAYHPFPADLFHWSKKESGELGNIGRQLPTTECFNSNLPRGVQLLQPFRWLSNGNLRRIRPGDGIEISGEDDGSLLGPDGLAKYLLGAAPVVQARLGDLFRREFRTGLERTATTRTAREGRLYSAEMVRLRADLPKQWSFYLFPVYAGAEALPGGSTVITVGGERRPFELSRESLAVPLADGLRQQVTAKLSAGDGPVDFRLYLASSAPPGAQGWLPDLPEIPGVELKILAAAVPRARWVSAWSVGQPLAARPFVPAGAVYFARAAAANNRQAVVEQIMDTFWNRAALVSAAGKTTEDLLTAKAGHGVTLVGVAAHGE